MNDEGVRAFLYKCVVTITERKGKLQCLDNSEKG